jgi:hypothetical protein
VGTVQNNPEVYKLENTFSRGGGPGGRKKYQQMAFEGKNMKRGREICAKCQRKGRKRERKEEKGEEKERKWK